MELLPPFEREGSICANCTSTWRNRATILSISESLGYGSLPLPQWPENWGVRGAGFDDPPVLFSRLPQKTIYTNTHLGNFPYLDLNDVPDRYIASLNFLVCGDVLEHVEPRKLDRAISGIAKLLMHGGFAVISVPIAPEEFSGEFYPDARDVVVVDAGHVRWQNASGEWIDDYEPEFHGGTGQVLAYRRFSERIFVESFNRNGFETVIRAPTNEKLGVPSIENSGLFIVWKLDSV